MPSRCRVSRTQARPPTGEIRRSKRTIAQWADGNEAREVPLGQHQADSWTSTRLWKLKPEYNSPSKPRWLLMEERKAGSSRVNLKAPSLVRLLQGRKLPWGASFVVHPPMTLVEGHDWSKRVRGGGSMRLVGFVAARSGDIGAFSGGVPAGQCTVDRCSAVSCLHRGRFSGKPR
jgi:hypothetical protein